MCEQVTLLSSSSHKMDVVMVQWHSGKNNWEMVIGN